MLIVNTIYGLNETGFNVDNILINKNGILSCNKGANIKVNNYIPNSKEELFLLARGINTIIETHENGNKPSCDRR